MRKLLEGLTAATLVVTSTSSVISCGIKHTFDTNIWIITDGGTITDLSFNESAWEGASEYVVTTQDPQNSENWKQSAWRASYYEAAGQTPSEFKTAYLTAQIAGAKTLILPGFNHGNTLGWAAALADNIIYIDGSGQNIHFNMDVNQPIAKNIVGLQYNAEASGFFAGIAGAMYLNAHQNQFKDTLKIGAFGGMDNPVAVSNYLWGFIISSDIFNIIINGDPSKYPNLTSLKPGLLKQVQALNSQTTTLKPISKVQKVLKNDESWFSQSFEPGHGKDMSDYLIANDASLIFPVAGPQTQDTIDRIKYSNANTRVIGVDTEQSKIYGDKYVVTSALKELAVSTRDALKNIYSSDCGYLPDSNSWDSTQATSACWLNSDQSSIQHPTWTGIETTTSTPQSTVDYIHDNSGNKPTAYDLLVAVLEKAYSIGIDGNAPIARDKFVDSLANTYAKEDTLQEFLLNALEKSLEGYHG